MFLKYVSYRSSKGKLLQALRPMRREDFSRLINPIIAESRKIEVREARQKKFLQSNEVLGFLNKIGENPTRYGRDIVLVTHQMTRVSLRKHIHLMSEPEFNKIIAKIVSENRKREGRLASKRRYLRPKEVYAFLEVIGEISTKASTSKKIGVDRNGEK